MALEVTTKREFVTMVVDDLLISIIQGFADDSDSGEREIDRNDTTVNVIHPRAKQVTVWCSKWEHLVNPTRTTDLPFTKTNNLAAISLLNMGGVRRAEK